MSYTNTWNESQPTDANAADTIDDLFRSLKLDLRERINSVLGVATGTALADPIVASTSSLAQLRTEVTALEGGAIGTNPLWATQTYTLFIPWSAGVWLCGDWNAAVTAGRQPIYTSGTGGGLVGGNGFENVNGQVPVILPVGTTVTAVDSVWNSTAGNTPTMQFRKLTSAGTATQIGASSGALHTTGYGTKSVFSGTEVLAADTTYWIYVVTPGATANALAGFIVTYTSANANVRI